MGVSDTDSSISILQEVLSYCLKEKGHVIYKKSKFGCEQCMHMPQGNTAWGHAECGSYLKDMLYPSDIQVLLSFACLCMLQALTYMQHVACLQQD